MHQISVIHTKRGLSYLEALNWDTCYQFLLESVLNEQTLTKGRNGGAYKAITNTVVDLRISFPLSGLRKLPISKYIDEVLFDIKPDNHIDALETAKVFWNGYAHESGYLGGSGYNRQWRMWPPSKEDSNVPGEELEDTYSVDQLSNVVETLKQDPGSRRAVAITHNPTCLNAVCPPCHSAMIFSPEYQGSNKEKFLDLMVPARSNDLILG